MLLKFEIEVCNLLHGIYNSSEVLDLSSHLKWFQVDHAITSLVCVHGFCCYVKLLKRVQLKVSA